MSLTEALARKRSLAGLALVVFIAACASDDEVSVLRGGRFAPPELARAAEEASVRRCWRTGAKVDPFQVRLGYDKREIVLMQGRHRLASVSLPYRPTAVAAAVDEASFYVAGIFDDGRTRIERCRAVTRPYTSDGAVTLERRLLFARFGGPVYRMTRMHPHATRLLLHRFDSRELEGLDLTTGATWPMTWPMSGPELPRALDCDVRFALMGDYDLLCTFPHPGGGAAYALFDRGRPCELPCPELLVVDVDGDGRVDAFVTKQTPSMLRWCRETSWHTRLP